MLLNDLGYYVDISMVIKFLQYFNYLKVLLCSWMSRWCLYILGTWIEVVNYLEKLLI